MYRTPRPTLPVEIEHTGDCYPCGLDESLLQGMVRLGRKGIPVGCVNGGCGVCKVQVLEGVTRSLGPISRAHVDLEEESRGLTLACRVAPVSPVRLAVADKLEKCLKKAAARAAAASRP